MIEDKVPVTRATEILKTAGVPFTDHLYKCDERGSTEVCAKELNIDEHAIVKTVLIEADGKPYMILMHGDMRASAKELAAIIGAKSVTPCLADKVEELTGYQTGGVSPFGTRIEIPVCMEETILNLRKIYVNGGRRGYYIGIDPYDLVKILHPVLVKVGSARGT